MIGWVFIAFAIVGTLAFGMWVALPSLLILAWCARQQAKASAP